MTRLLDPGAIRLGLRAADRTEAVAQAGKALLDVGAIDEPYMDAMHERERSLSTFLGEGFALPHGTDVSRVHVRHPAIAVLQFPEGVDWGGQQVYVAIAVASATDEHVSILAQVAGVISDPERAERLRTAEDPDEVMELLAPEGAAHARPPGGAHAPRRPRVHAPAGDKEEQEVAT